MKRVTAAAVILCLGLTANCFALTPAGQKAAREAMETGGRTEGGAGSNTQGSAALATFAGEVVSIKKTFNQVVIKDPRTSVEKIFTVKPEYLKSFKLGDSVEVKYKNGSNTAESITAAKPSRPSPGY